MNNVSYVGNIGYHKTIAVIRSQYFCSGMKNYVVDYISRCMECQRVKVEHRKSVGLLQPFPILEKKWEAVTTNLITKFPRTIRKHDSIMVVVDKLTKYDHFVPLKNDSYNN
jgi:hypothetical protein